MKKFSEFLNEAVKNKISGAALKRVLATSSIDHAKTNQYFGADGWKHENRRGSADHTITLHSQDWKHRTAAEKRAKAEFAAGKVTADPHAHLNHIIKKYSSDAAAAHSKHMADELSDHLTANGIKHTRHFMDLSGDAEPRHTVINATTRSSCHLIKGRKIN